MNWLTCEKACRVMSLLMCLFILVLMVNLYASDKLSSVLTSSVSFVPVTELTVHSVSCWSGREECLLFVM